MAKFKVGDVVTVCDEGQRYGTYFRFFSANKAPYDIAARYQHNSIVGPDYFASTLFEIVFVGKHEDEDIPIYAIANRAHHDFAPVYLFGEDGLSLCEKCPYVVAVDTAFSIWVDAYSEKEAESEVRDMVYESINNPTLCGFITNIKVRNAVEEAEFNE